MTTKYQSIKQPLIFHLILAQHIFQMIVIYLIFCFLDVTDKSKKINQQTSQLKWGAKKLEMNVIWRQYAPYVIIGVVVLLVIVIKFAF